MYWREKLKLKPATRKLFEEVEELLGGRELDKQAFNLALNTLAGSARDEEPKTVWILWSYDAEKLFKTENPHVAAGAYETGNFEIQRLKELPTLSKEDLR